MACKGPARFGGALPELEAAGNAVISYNLQCDFTMANLSILPDSSATFGRWRSHLANSLGRRCVQPLDSSDYAHVCHTNQNLFLGPVPPISSTIKRFIVPSCFMFRHSVAAKPASIDRPHKALAVASLRDRQCRRNRCHKSVK